jgi:hypothetical protein
MLNINCLSLETRDLKPNDIKALHYICTIKKEGNYFLSNRLLNQRLMLFV